MSLPIENDAPMTTPDKPPDLPRRADARRNRRRLLKAAKTVVASDGAAASLQAIARGAGVGIGTLYRHFPTREALYTAVYEQEVDALIAQSATYAATVPPVVALRRWLQALAALVATKTGMAGALAISAETKSAVTHASTDRLIAALADLLDNARATGVLVPTLAPRELLHTVVGMCLIQTDDTWQQRVAISIDLLVDGMCRSCE